MAEAAHVLDTEPISLQLRYLQTLREIAAEKNSTTLFPIPIDLVKPFIKIAARLGYPRMVRPSYVLGGRGMQIVHDEDMLREYEIAGRGTVTSH